MSEIFVVRREGGGEYYTCDREDAEEAYRRKCWRSPVPVVMMRGTPGRYETVIKRFKGCKS